MKRAVLDVLVVAISVLAATAIAKSDVVYAVFASGNDGGLLASFVAGLFFTSIFTAAPATVVLAELSVNANPLVVVVAGAFGAVAGDYAMYVFMRQRLLRDASRILERSRLHRVWQLLQRRRYHRLLQVCGIVLLASPLPDEPALAMLGLSSISARSFFVLSFTTHAIGIAAIALVARAL